MSGIGRSAGNDATPDRGSPSFESASCPVPLGHERVQLGHGSGGRMTRELIERIFLPAYGAGPGGEPLHDAARIRLEGTHLALTTDAYVVSPLFFPGGDIGRLAVLGTVNDLAMGGARPGHLAASFVLEEGLPLVTLERVARSMGAAAQAAGVRIVAGDTKVVERGRADGLYVTTSGVGEVVADVSPRRIAEGDVVLVNRDLGCHGIAVLAERHALGFEPPLESDCADLWPSVRALLEAGVDVHCLRDLTRGGLSTALCELASAAGVDIDVREADVPLGEPVRGAAELLGLDPLHVASEGAFVAFVPEHQARLALDALRSQPASRDPRAIGRACSVRARRPRVVLESAIGGSRLLESLPGEQLPRIC